jgi:hypothetical protein
VFPELAFVRFAVYESFGGQLLAQRVHSVKSVRQGYRHVRLRNAQNQPLDLTTLFVCTRQQVERVVVEQSGATTTGAATTTATGGLTATGSAGPSPAASILDLKQQQKHKQFKVTIYYGPNGDDDDDECGAVTIKATQETTAQQAIEQALPLLLKTKTSLKEPEQCVLVQEVEKRWTNNNNNNNSNNTSSILDVLVRSRRDASAVIRRASSSSYQHQRTKSLCVNESGANSNSVNNLIGGKKAAKKQQLNNRNGIVVAAAAAKENAPPLDTRVIHSQERILEAQNKWTGNGKFIIKDKSAYERVIKKSNCRFIFVFSFLLWIKEE